MKKVSLLLISVISIFAFSKVNAADCDGFYLYAKDNFATDNVIKMNYGEGNVGKRLTLQNSSNSNLTAYCRNVAKTAGQTVAGATTPFKCTHSVFSPDEVSLSNDLKMIYEAGVVEILSKSSNNPSNEAYTTTDLAIKTYELLWSESINTNNINSGTQTNYLRAYQFFANKMLDDSEIATALRNATGNVRSRYNNAVSYGWATSSQTIEDGAKNLIKAGLAAAIKYKNEGRASLVWNESPVVSRDIVTEEAGVKNYSGSISYDFDIDKFDVNEGAYARIRFNCENCSSNGITYTLFVNDNNLGDNYTSEINLLDYATTGSGRVTLKVAFKTTSNTYSCQGIDYTIDVNYFDKSIGSEVYDMYSTDRKCLGGGCQHLYVLVNKNSERTRQIKNEFALCNITCEDLKAKCEASSSNSSICQEYRKQYPSGCINCGVDIKNNECADPGEFTTLDLIEGYEIDPETCEQKSTENVNGCILDKKDVAGNSYVDASLNNGYCSVSCKEDFHFKLPGNRDVTSGRYFDLSFNVTGTKTCYMKLNANRNAIINDFKDKAKLSNTLFESCEISKALDSATPIYEDSRTCSYAEANYGGNVSRCVQDLKNSGYTAINANNICRAMTGKCGSDTNNVIRYEINYTVANNNCASVTIPKVLLPDKYNALKQSTASACNDLAELNALGQGYQTGFSSDGGKIISFGSMEYYGGSSTSMYNGVGALNTCLNWDMTYDFNPDFYYSYEESYIKSALSKKFELIGDVSKSNTKKYYCSGGEHDDAYKLCNGSENGWSTEPIYETISTCICDTDGCEIERLKVSSTDRMKESIDVSASYKLPTQFYTIYPGGSVVASKSGEGLENASELTNALPVGLGAPQGIRHYAIYAENLGEYYGTDKLGRVWGNRNSVVSATLKSTDKCFKDGALKYDVTLEIPNDNGQTDNSYIDEGVYVCDYNVNTGSCVKTISDDGKVTYRDKDGNITDEETYNRDCQCPRCPVTCDKDGCRCNGDKCQVVCPTCVYNNGKNFEYRNISLNDLNPNNRNLGANWRYDDKQISTALEMKAMVTTEEIITSGETIYDESTNPYVMKVKLDSAMINKIKNRDEKNYLTNTLKCYDYTENGKTYKNIFCYSTFIDELVSDSKNKDKISFSTERPFSEASRKDSQNSSYWTTWTKALENRKWEITTSKGLSYLETKYGEIGIGPSWK